MKKRGEGFAGTKGGGKKKAFGVLSARDGDQKGGSVGGGRKLERGGKQYSARFRGGSKKQ